MTGQTYEEYSRNTLLGTPAMVIDRIGQMVDAGVDYVIVNFPLVAYDHEPMQRFVEEVMPAFAGS